MMTALAKSSELTSGATFSFTRSPPTMVGVKCSRTPNSLNWMVTVLAAALALHDGIGILAAGQEAGFLAVLGNQVRLGEALEEALGLQRLDDAAQVVLAVEEEQVQEVAEAPSRPVLVLSKAGAANCCVVVRPNQRPSL